MGRGEGGVGAGVGRAGHLCLLLLFFLSCKGVVVTGCLTHLSGSGFPSAVM